MLGQIVSLIEQVDEQGGGKPAEASSGGVAASRVEVVVTNGGLSENDCSGIRQNAVSSDAGGTGASVVGQVPTSSPFRRDHLDSSRGGDVDDVAEDDDVAELLAPEQLEEDARSPLKGEKEPHNAERGDAPSSPAENQAQPGLLVSSSEVEKLAACCADLHVECEGSKRRVALLEQQLSAAREQLDQMHDDDNALLVAGDDRAGDAAEARYKQEAALEEKFRRPLENVERVVQFHAETIRSLEHSNACLRKQLLVDEAERLAEMQRLRTELETATFDALRYTEALGDSERRRVEVTRLVKKVSALQQHSAELGTQAASLRGQLDSAMSLLAQREDENEQLRVVGAQMREINTTPIYQSLGGTWYGSSLQRAFAAADQVSMRTGRLLHNNAVLRVFVAFYALLLHLYVFHVVSSVVHLMPAVGDDVHDHVQNHLHHS